MCEGVVKDALLFRKDRGINEYFLEISGCRRVEYSGRNMNGWVLVDQEPLRSDSELMYLIGLALDFNKEAERNGKKNPKNYLA